MVLDTISFYGKESSGQQLVEYNIDSIINVLRSCGLSSNTTTVKQQAVIEGLNNIGNSRQGTSVSLSSDGNTAAIGCPLNNSSIGAVLVFIRIGETWEQQYGPIIGSGNTGSSQQGTSVSLSSNGNILAVGGIGDNGGIGAAWIFVRTNSAWTQQGSKLVGTTYIGNSQQGSSVSLSSNGDTLVVGGKEDNGGVGATWVFTRSGIIWSQQSKLIGTGNTGNSKQGTSTSLSSDGNTLAVGGPSDNSSVGTVWIFFRAGITWSQQGSKLVGTGNVSASTQGTSVALSQNGDTLIIGGPGNDGGIGAIWMFTRSLTIWNQIQGPVIGTAALGSSNQGISISLGLHTIIVGGSGNNENIGAFWMFDLDNVLKQKSFRITGTGYQGDSLQGYSVNISTDESTIIIGGPGNNNGVGSSWIFKQLYT
jgi:hypothetical protein